MGVISIYVDKTDRLSKFISAAGLEAYSSKEYGLELTLPESTDFSYEDKNTLIRSSVLAKRRQNKFSRNYVQTSETVLVRRTGPKINNLTLTIVDLVNNKMNANMTINIDFGRYSYIASAGRYGINVDYNLGDIQPVIEMKTFVAVYDKYLEEKYISEKYPEIHTEDVKCSLCGDTIYHKGTDISMSHYARRRCNKCTKNVNAYTADVYGLCTVPRG